MKMTALQDQAYGRKRYRKGETMDVGAGDARLLTAIGRAEEYRKPAKAGPVTQRTVMTVEAPTVARTTESKAPPARTPRSPRASTATPTEQPAATRRTYRRRDVQSQG